jgi:hypothetical protein
MRYLSLLVIGGLVACARGSVVVEPSMGCARFGYRAMELRGRVTDDATREPIPGATVLRGEGLSDRVTTNERGEYSFRPLAVGPHSVEVVKAGYSPERRDLGVQDDDTLRGCDQDTAAVLNFSLRRDR